MPTDPLLPVAILRKCMPLVGGAAGLVFGMVALPSVLRLPNGQWLAAALATAVMCGWTVHLAMCRPERAGLRRTLLLAAAFGIANVAVAFFAATVVGGEGGRAIPMAAIAAVIGAPIGATLGLVFGLAVSVPVARFVDALREPTPDRLDRCVIVAGMWLAHAVAILVVVDPMAVWWHGWAALEPGAEPLQPRVTRGLAAVLGATGLAFAIAAAWRSAARRRLASARTLGRITTHTARPRVTID